MLFTLFTSTVEFLLHQKQDIPKMEALHGVQFLNAAVSFSRLTIESKQSTHLLGEFFFTKPKLQSIFSSGHVWADLKAL